MPKKWSYYLWLVVIFRCLCPVIPESNISIYNLLSKQLTEPTYQINISEYTINHIVTPTQQQFNDNTNTPYYIIFVTWLSVLCIIITYNLVLNAKLSSKLKYATKLKNNIYISENISSAFTGGLFPKIYLPDGLSRIERKYIILHEKTHIRRGDHIIKYLAFITLCIHWFNPLIWVAFTLTVKDMELSCDEEVMNITNQKKIYSNILLKNSINQSYSEVSIYFGKSYVKERVRNVLNYKKPRFIVNVVLCLLVLGVSVALGTNKKTTAASTKTTSQIDQINADIGELIVYKEKLESNENAVDYFEKLEHIKRQIEMIENSDIKDEDKEFYINLYNNVAAEIIFLNAKAVEEAINSKSVEEAYLSSQTN